MRRSEVGLKIDSQQSLGKFTLEAEGLPTDWTFIPVLLVTVTSALAKWFQMQIPVFNGLSLTEMAYQARADLGAQYEDMQVIRPEVMQ